MIDVRCFVLHVMDRSIVRFLPIIYTSTASECYRPFDLGLGNDYLQVNTEVPPTMRLLCCSLSLLHSRPMLFRITQPSVLCCTEQLSDSTSKKRHKPTPL